VEERCEIGERERSEERDVSFDGCNEEAEDVALGSRRLQVSSIDVLGNLLVGIGQNLVDVVETFGIDIPAR